LSGAAPLAGGQECPHYAYGLRRSTCVTRTLLLIVVFMKAAY
jgi:hypothetical protein